MLKGCETVEKNCQDDGKQWKAIYFTLINIHVRCMFRAARYVASHATYLSKRHGVASHITTGPVMQPPMAGKWGVHKNLQVHWRQSAGRQVSRWSRQQSPILLEKSKENKDLINKRCKRSENGSSGNRALLGQ